MTRYALAYRFGLTPWERYGTAAAASIGPCWTVRRQSGRARWAGRSTSGAAVVSTAASSRGAAGGSSASTTSRVRVNAAKRTGVAAIDVVVGDVTDLRPAELGTSTSSSTSAASRA